MWRNMLQIYLFHQLGPLSKQVLKFWSVTNSLTNLPFGSLNGTVQLAASLVHGGWQPLSAMGKAPGKAPATACLASPRTFGRTAWEVPEASQRSGRHLRRSERPPAAQRGGAGGSTGPWAVHLSDYRVSLQVLVGHVD